jgi:hypothetical protein
MYLYKNIHNTHTPKETYYKNEYRNTSLHIV